ncbi:MAG: exonuclease domain-containing protein [Eubacterium sp.]|nr:exonuclease domain-containing protein [Eubacterium sp.]
MKYIVLDLEMNGVPKGKGTAYHACHMEIIEIGAVALDDDYNEVGNFVSYVKPRFNDKIEERYERITGISTEMVKDAPEFEEAFGKFYRWCEELNDQYEIITWSTNDETQVRKEMMQKNYVMSAGEEKFMEGWRDFQKKFGEVLGLSRILSLDKAVELMGLDFQGKQHDALNDARNTAEIFAIMFDDKRDKSALNRVKDALKPKEVGVSLGDMIDFSQFMEE